MNHLAHALLAGPDPDLIVGGLMGDFVSGPVAPDLPPGVAFGLRLHRAIDVYTDAHALVRGARGLFAPPFRRYAGILLDVWFDHLLARDFARHSGGASLRAFSDGLLALLSERQATLPASLQHFLHYMRSRDLPYAYADRRAIGQVFAGLATRLTRANPLAEALPALAAVEAELDTCFAAFFPQLQAYARARRSEAGHD